MTSSTLPWQLLMQTAQPWWHHPDCLDSCWCKLLSHDDIIQIALTVVDANCTAMMTSSRLPWQLLMQTAQPWWHHPHCLDSCWCKLLSHDDIIHIALTVVDANCTAMMTSSRLPWQLLMQTAQPWWHHPDCLDSCWCKLLSHDDIIQIALTVVDANCTSMMTSSRLPWQLLMQTAQPWWHHPDCLDSCWCKLHSHDDIIQIALTVVDANCSAMMTSSRLPWQLLMQTAQPWWHHPDCLDSCWCKLLSHDDIIHIALTVVDANCSAMMTSSTLPWQLLMQTAQPWWHHPDCLDSCWCKLHSHDDIIQIALTVVDANCSAMMTSSRLPWQLLMQTAQPWWHHPDCLDSCWCKLLSHDDIIHIALTVVDANCSAMMTSSTLPWQLLMQTAQPWWHHPDCLDSCWCKLHSHDDIIQIALTVVDANCSAMMTSSTLPWQLLMQTAQPWWHHPHCLDSCWCKLLSHDDIIHIALTVVDANCSAMMTSSTLPWQLLMQTAQPWWHHPHCLDSCWCKLLSHDDIIQIALTVVDANCSAMMTSSRLPWQLLMQTAQPWWHHPDCLDSCWCKLLSHDDIIQIALTVVDANCSAMMTSSRLPWQLLMQTAQPWWHHPDCLDSCWCKLHSHDDIIQIALTVVDANCSAMMTSSRLPWQLLMQTAQPWWHHPDCLDSCWCKLHSHDDIIQIALTVVDANCSAMMTSSRLPWQLLMQTAQPWWHHPDCLDSCWCKLHSHDDIIQIALTVVDANCTAMMTSSRLPWQLLMQTAQPWWHHPDCLDSCWCKLLSHDDIIQIALTVVDANCSAMMTSSRLPWQLLMQTAQPWWHHPDCLDSCWCKLLSHDDIIQIALTVVDANCSAMMTSSRLPWQLLMQTAQPWWHHPDCLDSCWCKLHSHDDIIQIALTVVDANCTAMMTSSRLPWQLLMQTAQPWWHHPDCLDSCWCKLHSHDDIIQIALTVVDANCTAMMTSSRLPWQLLMQTAQPWWHHPDCLDSCWCKLLSHDDIIQIALTVVDANCSAMMTSSRLPWQLLMQTAQPWWHHPDCLDSCWCKLLSHDDIIQIALTVVDANCTAMMTSSRLPWQLLMQTAQPWWHHPDCLDSCWCKLHSHDDIIHIALTVVDANCSAMMTSSRLPWQLLMQTAQPWWHHPDCLDSCWCKLLSHDDIIQIALTVVDANCTAMMTSSRLPWQLLMQTAQPWWHHPDCLDSCWCKLLSHDDIIQIALTVVDANCSAMMTSSRLPWQLLMQTAQPWWHHPDCLDSCWCKLHSHDDIIQIALTVVDANCTAMMTSSRLPWQLLMQTAQPWWHHPDCLDSCWCKLHSHDDIIQIALTVVDANCTAMMTSSRLPWQLLMQTAQPWWHHPDCLDSCWCKLLSHDDIIQIALTVVDANCSAMMTSSRLPWQLLMQTAQPWWHHPDCLDSCWCKLLSHDDIIQIALTVVDANCTAMMTSSRLPWQLLMQTAQPWWHHPDCLDSCWCKLHSHDDIIQIALTVVDANCSAMMTSSRLPWQLLMQTAQPWWHHPDCLDSCWCKLLSHDDIIQIALTVVDANCTAMMTSSRLPWQLLMQTAQPWWHHPDCLDSCWCKLLSHDDIIQIALTVVDANCSAMMTSSRLPWQLLMQTAQPWWHHPDCLDSCWCKLHSHDDIIQIALTVVDANCTAMMTSSRLPWQLLMQTAQPWWHHPDCLDSCWCKLHSHDDIIQIALTVVDANCTAMMTSSRLPWQLLMQTAQPWWHHPDCLDSCWCKLLSHDDIIQIALTVVDANCSAMMTSSRLPWQLLMQTAQPWWHHPDCLDSCWCKLLSHDDIIQIALTVVDANCSAMMTSSRLPWQLLMQTAQPWWHHPDCLDSCWCKLHSHDDIIQIALTVVDANCTAMMTSSRLPWQLLMQTAQPWWHHPDCLDSCWCKLLSHDDIIQIALTVVDANCSAMMTSSRLPWQLLMQTAQPWWHHPHCLDSCWCKLLSHDDIIQIALTVVDANCSAMMTSSRLPWQLLMQTAQPWWHHPHCLDSCWCKLHSHDDIIQIALTVVDANCTAMMTSSRLPWQLLMQTAQPWWHHPHCLDSCWCKLHSHDDIIQIALTVVDANCTAMMTSSRLPWQLLMQTAQPWWHHPHCLDSCWCKLHSHDDIIHIALTVVDANCSAMMTSSTLPWQLLMQTAQPWWHHPHCLDSCWCKLHSHDDIIHIALTVVDANCTAMMTSSRLPWQLLMQTAQPWWHHPDCLDSCWCKLHSHDDIIHIALTVVDANCSAMMTSSTLPWQLLMQTAQPWWHHPHCLDSCWCKLLSHDDIIQIALTVVDANCSAMMTSSTLPWQLLMQTAQPWWHHPHCLDSCWCKLHSHDDIIHIALTVVDANCSAMMTSSTLPWQLLMQTAQPWWHHPHCLDSCWCKLHSHDDIIHIALTVVDANCSAMMTSSRLPWQLLMQTAQPWWHHPDCLDSCWCKLLSHDDIIQIALTVVDANCSAMMTSSRLPWQLLMQTAQPWWHHPDCLDSCWCKLLSHDDIIQIALTVVDANCTAMMTSSRLPWQLLMQTAQPWWHHPDCLDSCWCKLLSHDDIIQIALTVVDANCSAMMTSSRLPWQLLMQTAQPWWHHPDCLDSCWCKLLSHDDIIQIALTVVDANCSAMMTSSRLPWQLLMQTAQPWWHHPDCLDSCWCKLHSHDDIIQIALTVVDANCSAMMTSSRLPWQL